MTIPFSRPYTSPDGTPRRSAWDRCPELRPTIRGQPLGRHPCEKEPTRDGWITPGMCVSLPDEAASALARVAAEDWLLHSRQGANPDRDCHLTSARAGKYHIDSSDIPWDMDGIASDHDTIELAINAALHAVLDAKGVK